eukprot:3613222-Rhodomonas_salina.1
MQFSSAVRHNQPGKAAAYLHEHLQQLCVVLICLSSVLRQTVDGEPSLGVHFPHLFRELLSHAKHHAKLTSCDRSFRSTKLTLKSFRSCCASCRLAGVDAIANPWIGPVTSCSPSLGATSDDAWLP